ncbi:hypothetical protein ABFS82_10G146800 [Erythranthe guttata]
MAYNNKNNRISTICLISLLLFAAASTPPAHGQVITLRGLSVSGSLCCTPTGNCPGRGIPGVPVSLNCTIVGVGARVLGRNTTNVNGTFNITVPAITGLILGLPTLPCLAIVQLPLNSTVCPPLSTINGVLAGSYQPNSGLILATFVVRILRWFIIPSG